MKNFFKQIWFHTEVILAVIWDFKWHILSFFFVVFIICLVFSVCSIFIMEILSNPKQIGNDVGKYLNEFKKGYENANNR